MHIAFISVILFAYEIITSLRLHQFTKCFISFYSSVTCINVAVLFKRLKSFLMLLMVVVTVLNSEQNYFKTNLKYVIGIPKCFLHDIILSIEIFSLRYPSFMSHFVHFICSKTHWTRDTD